MKNVNFTFSCIWSFPQIVPHYVSSNPWIWRLKTTSPRSSNAVERLTATLQLLPTTDSSAQLIKSFHFPMSQNPQTVPSDSQYGTSTSRLSTPCRDPVASLLPKDLSRPHPCLGAAVVLKGKKRRHNVSDLVTPGRYVSAFTELRLLWKLLSDILISESLKHFT